MHITSNKPHRPAVVPPEKGKDMKKLTEDVYTHRGYWIIKDKQGICIENHLEIFKTWNDAKEFINKITDGTHKKEPRIIGEWKE